MEENVLDTNLPSQLSVTPEIQSFLRETAKWGKFMAIVGFVFTALIMILAIGMSFFMSSALAEIADEPGMGMFGAIGGGFISFIYILFGLMYFFPCLYLYRFSTRMKIALAQNDQQYLHESFMNLKSLYKYWGIFTAVILGFYALIFLFGLLGGLAAFI